MDLKQEFGQKIKNMRLRRGFSQEVLAERANLHRTYVTDIERGTRNLTLESISKLEFYDAQGNKVEAQKRSWGGGGFLGYMVEYVFKKGPDRAKIVATCWQDLKTVEVPFSVKTGVGL